MKNLLKLIEEIKGSELCQSEMDNLRTALYEDLKEDYILKKDADVKFERIKTDARQIINKAIITLETNKELSKFHSGDYTHKLKAFYNQNVIKFMDESISQIKFMFKNLKSLHLYNDDNDLPF